MPTRNERTLDQARARFAAETKYGKALLDLLAREEISAYSLRQDEKHSQRWWLYINLPPRLGEIFDTGREILLMYADWATVQPRVLDDIRQELASHSRLDQNIVFVATSDPQVDRLARNPRGCGFSLIPVDTTQLAENHVVVKHVMAEWLPVFDRYDVTTPVVGGSDFFGRADELRDLEFRIDHLQSVGMFGLRKAGKSSVLKTTAQTRRSAGRLVVEMDLSKISGCDHFLRQLLAQSIAAMARVLRLSESATMRWTRENLLLQVSEEDIEGSRLREVWIEDLSAVIRNAGATLELFLDELDTAFPGQGAQFESSELERFYTAFRQLRGLLQNHSPQDPGAVLVCAGVNPSIFERAVLPDGRNNQLYRVVQVNYIKPLPRDDASKMVRDLGGLMGIKYRDPRVTELIFDLFGGHPMLTRKACSQISKRRPPAAFPWNVTIEEVEAVWRQKGLGSMAEERGEIWAQFSEWFPAETDVVRMLNSEDEGEVNVAKTFVVEDPDSVKHAIGYGLLSELGDPIIPLQGVIRL